MPIKTISFLFLISIFVAPINGLSPRKQLDETAAPGTENCTPCTQSPPPPLPASPPPPPPYQDVSPPPPPPKKKPSSSNCPPPPPTSSFIYITGPPGNLYPIDQDFNGAVRHGRATLPVLIGCGLILLLVVVA